MNLSATLPAWHAPARTNFHGILVSVVAFAVLVAINSTGVIPAVAQQSLQTLSTWLLVVSMAAIGMKSNMRDFAKVGMKPIMLMVSETVFLAILVVAFIHIAR